MKIGLISLVALGLLGLTGCRTDYPVHAVFLKGKLHFVGVGKSSFFGKDGFCPSYFTVRDEARRTMWRIESDRGPSNCNLFPLGYGEPPPEWRTVVKPERLLSGHLYIINGNGGDRYHGAFRYKERIALIVENAPKLSTGYPEEDN